MIPECARPQLVSRCLQWINFEDCLGRLARHPCRTGDHFPIQSFLNFIVVVALVAVPAAAGATTDAALVPMLLLPIPCRGTRGDPGGGGHVNGMCSCSERVTVVNKQAQGL